LDEADEMLSMGFKTQLEKILEKLPHAKQKWLFSATMPEGITQIVNAHMKPNAYRIEVAQNEEMNKNIEHQYFVCNENQKFDALLATVKSHKNKRGIVFCRTKASTQKVATQLIAKGIAADAIHGDLKQIERDKVMRSFKKSAIQVLVATDIAARGIDIEALEYVVHFQLPDKDEYFTHRSGRTARAGKRGLSFSIVSPDELKQLKFLGKKLNLKLNQV
jgi:ATP-dependent RNA helicase DeaD